MRTYIKVSQKLRSEICEKFNISKNMLWKSLTGLRNSKTAKEARDYALSHGGKWISEVNFIPDCETRHLPEGGFVQEFKNGVLVQSQGNKVTIMRKGKSLAEFTDVTLNAWGNVLVVAQSLASGMSEAQALRKMTEA